jgi:hypothetical protein
VINTRVYQLDDETIRFLELKPVVTPLTAEIPSAGRVFAYPHLKDVYIMESDLYGNEMPEGSCFLAFPGTHGLMGEHLKIEALLTATPGDIMRLVKKDHNG